MVTKWNLPEGPSLNYFKIREFLQWLVGDRTRLLELTYVPVDNNYHEKGFRVIFLNDDQDAFLLKLVNKQLVVRRVKGQSKEVTERMFALLKEYRFTKVEP